jgi:CRP-like cAMP-binding protein
LHDTTRRAHAYAVTECRLMQLMKSDFHGLMETEPTLRAEIAEVAADRLRKGEWSSTDLGDMPDDEIRDQPLQGE